MAKPVRQADERDERMRRPCKTTISMHYRRAECPSERSGGWVDKLYARWAREVAPHSASGRSSRTCPSDVHMAKERGDDAYNARLSGGPCTEETSWRANSERQNPSWHAKRSRACRAVEEATSTRAICTPGVFRRQGPPESRSVRLRMDHSCCGDVSARDVDTSNCKGVSARDAPKRDARQCCCSQANSWSSSTPGWACGCSATRGKPTCPPWPSVRTSSSFGACARCC